MDTKLPQKFPFILDRNLAKANCTGNHVCTSCDTVVLGLTLIKIGEALVNFHGHVPVIKNHFFYAIYDKVISFSQYQNVWLMSVLPVNIIAYKYS